jgi:hypothetical protein
MPNSVSENKQTRRHCMDWTLSWLVPDYLQPSCTCFFFIPTFSPTLIHLFPILL